MTMKSVAFAVVCVLAVLAPVHAGASPRALPINDHLIAFYDGRTPERTYPEWNWFDDAAMLLGVATYAVYDGDEALVYDTFASVEQARWVRNYLETELGIEHFTVVHSHWHLDHVAGNEVYADSPIIIEASGLQKLIEQKDAIEAGTTILGPPAIHPLVLPNTTYQGQMTLYAGSIRVELLSLNIHSSDSTVLLLPADRILLAGDTVEDTVTFIAEPADLRTHVGNLAVLRALPWDRTFPNHGDPDVIAAGGYGRGIVDATAEYLDTMLSRAPVPGFLNMPLEAFAARHWAHGWTSLWEPYRDVHTWNLGQVSSVWSGTSP